jgi:hypothetical protein
MNCANPSQILIADIGKSKSSISSIVVKCRVRRIAPVGYVFYQAHLSPDNWVYQDGSATNRKDGGAHGVPAPLVGAGLPIIAVGYGVY